VTAENKAALQRAIDQWNAGDLEGYLQLYDPSVTLHGYPGVTPGLESVRQFYEGFCAAVPGSQLTLDGIVAEGDEVATRFTLRGTHRGELMGVPATGKDVTVPGITILRFAGGKCVERWSQADFLGMLQQIGAIPAPA
jgi:predicted ester cyclase